MGETRPLAGDRDPAGEHRVRMEFAYDGGGLAKGGTVTLYVDGAEVGQERVEATQPRLVLDLGPVQIEQLGLQPAEAVRVPMRVRVGLRGPYFVAVGRGREGA